MNSILMSAGGSEAYHWLFLGVINQFEFSRMGTEPLLHPLPRFALDRIMPTYVQVYHLRVRQGIYSYVGI